MNIQLLCCLTLSLLLGACASTPTKETKTPQEDSDLGAHVTQGYDLLKKGKLNQAIIEFSQAVKLCEPILNGDKQIFTARTPAESMFYLVLAVASNENRSAEVLDTNCSDAYYLLGYSNLDQGKIKEAKTNIEKAVQLAPKNSMYLSELGHIYQTQRNWQEAMSYFTQSEEAAQKFSPEPVKLSELTRAKRGIGFNLIEIGKLDEAEKKLKEALELDPNDKNSLNEIQYIQQLRKQ